MSNQMMATGGLQTALKTTLNRLNVGESTDLINYSFASADIQECCDSEIRDKQFLIGNGRVDGSRTLTPITRVA